MKTEEPAPPETILEYSVEPRSDGTVWIEFETYGRDGAVTREFVADAAVITKLSLGLVSAAALAEEEKGK